MPIHSVGTVRMIGGAVILVTVMLSACAWKATVQSTQPSAGAASPEAMTVAVMTPMIRETNHRGNVGRAWETIQRR
jgi:hypothetical protein